MDKGEGGNWKEDQMESKDAETFGNDEPADAKSDSRPKASRPKRERRVEIAEDDTDNVPIRQDEDSLQNAESSGGNAPARPRRRRGADDEGKSSGSGGGGGWMSLSSENKTSKLAIEQDDDAIAPVAQNKDKHFQEGGDDIMIIPDLDEDGGDTDGRIAHAPKNVHRKIPTLADLEEEVKATIPTIEGGYNLAVLLATMVPQSQVQESDAAWTFETLLRDVTDELMAPAKTVTETTIKELPPVPTGGAAAAAGGAAAAGAGGRGAAAAKGGAAASSKASSEREAKGAK